MNTHIYTSTKNEVEEHIKNDFKIWDIVLVKEDNTPPTLWPLGRILEVYPGSDGHIRAVTLRMRAGPYENLKNKDCRKITETKRPVTKLVYLPTPEEEE